MKNTKLPKVLFVVGPTTSHKTRLGIEIAKKFNGEIINADAFQVYADMNIGTNAPTRKELKQAKFHLNQFLKLTDVWDIKKFQTLAIKTIADIVKRKKLPIVVGGSNLYVDALINNYDLSNGARTNKFDNWTNEKLYKELYSLSKKDAINIGRNNRKRLVRALQVITARNSKNALRAKNKRLYDYLLIECNYSSRQALYDSINAKVKEMFDDGWVNEVKKIAKKYKNIDLMNNNAFKALGYRDILLALESKDKVNISLIQQKIRHFAKRQITWIKNKYPSHLLYMQNNKAQIFKDIQKWLSK